MNSATGLAKRTLSLRSVGMLALVTVLAACKHPLKIIGEGDIVDLNKSGFGCTLVEFRANDTACTENESTGDYIVNYQGNPRPGWRFVRWEGPCDPSSEAPNCKIISPASFVQHMDTTLPGVPMPTTVAVFELIPAGAAFRVVLSDIDVRRISDGEAIEVDTQGVNSAELLLNK